MKRPGDRLRAWAAQWCCPAAMERVIDPMIADLQREHAGAMRDGRRWRSRWIRLQGAVAFLKVITLCAARALSGDTMSWTSDESRLLARTAGFSLAGIVAVTATFGAPSFLIYTPRPERFFYVIPQLLAIAIPIGIAIGIIAALAGVALSGRLRGGVVVLALAGAAASFTVTGWLAPLSFRADRDASGFPTQVRDFDGDDARSPQELTLGQLKARVDAAARFGLSPDVGYLWWLLQQYHARWAMPAATLTLTLCLLAMASFPRVGRLKLSITAFGLVVGYEALGNMTNILNVLNVKRQMSGPFAAWLPNLVLALIAVTLMMASRRSQTPVAPPHLSA